MEEVKDMNITFYGERGLVNSIILDMGSDLSKQKQFLRSIKFEDNSNRNWIDKVTDFHYIVEPSFAQFGNPDLIIVAECVCQSKSLAFGLEKLCTCQHNFVH